MKIAFINKTNYYFNVLINLSFLSDYYKNDITFAYDGNTNETNTSFIVFKTPNKTVITFTIMKYVF